MASNLLSDAALRRAKPTDKLQRLRDGDGLYLLLRPDGKRWWRFDYRCGGKDKTLSVGVYPDVTLARARQRADEIRQQLLDGIDPSVARKAKVTGVVTGVVTGEVSDSFEIIAREWHAGRAPTLSGNTSKNILLRLQNNAFPYIGQKSVRELRAPDVLDVLRRIEARGLGETARRVHQLIAQVMRYAVATGRADADPTPALRGALKPVMVRHHAAVIEPVELGAMLRAFEGYSGGVVVRTAVQLQVMLFVRPGELRRMEWAELDLDGAQWRIPGEKMKMREPHIVPLPQQAVALLKDLRPFSSRSRYVFPSPRSKDRPMSENAVNVALRALGFDRDTVTGHGFRATARTILDEHLRYRVEVIEMQLAHAVRDPLGRAYNRTKYLEERKDMMQAWADYLDKLKADSAISR
ncbi:MULTISPECIES: integrase arm-type DNA-binding domain-containing protein [unclassified Thiomonas]|uniref:tyrosine-type recombinase/integrase n=1 Tax=unclassified Thiomonas TaxID=2625466 RepID=UPI0004DBBFD5|nr:MULTISPECIES: integrase arm-type DNA-binding domain-containing protein [unclassified Thiomonas]CDW95062.1 putative Phage integrase [Thiomonas sp. CB2]VDY03874.1 putative Phage integrase [Thiomonas sp. Bio17B3]VDY08949.1 putative Phage integrase [Thiomonas sp. Sup16B3]VDY12123.1 putative Phage integrase [Thiomonas sp. OC7]VDY18660.1 putative Phage integrase [Thiomonas sp. CB2]